VILNGKSLSLYRQKPVRKVTPEQLPVFSRERSGLDLYRLDLPFVETFSLMRDFSDIL
jgi:hypothetical protein